MTLADRMGPTWIVTPTLEVGGGEWAAVRMANALARRSVATTVVTLAGGGPLEERLAPGVERRHVSASRAVGALPGLASRLARQRPSTVVSHQMRANRVVLAARRLVRGPARTLVVEHSLARRQLDQLPGACRPLAGPVLRRLYRHAPVVAAVSGCAAREIASVLDLGRPVEVLPNIVPDLDPAAPSRSGSAGEASGPGAPSEPARLLFVGRLVPEKGLDTLLDALPAVRARVDVALEVVGDGPDRGRIAGRIRRNGLAGCVELLGARDDVRRRMRQADLLVLPSRVEAMPTVLIEALAEGTPVVAADVPCGPAEVLAGGRYGRLVPAGDAGALAEAVLAELRDPADRTGVGDHLRRFGEDAVLHRLGELLDAPAA